MTPCGFLGNDFSSWGHTQGFSGITPESVLSHDPGKLGGPYGELGIEPGPAACQANYPSDYAIAPTAKTLNLTFLGGYLFWGPYLAVL